MSALSALNFLEIPEVQEKISEGDIVSVIMNVKFSSDQSDLDLDELSTSELNRFFAFKSEEQAKLFYVGRLLVRHILSSFIGKDNYTIEIGPHGKPYVIHPDSPRFNLSHCNGGILAGFSKNTPLGVDVEYLNRKVRMEAISRRFFTDQERSWISDQGKEGFFRVWTRKEARVKATGGGISSGFSSLCTCSEKDWAYEEVSGPGLIGAVAYKGPVRSHCLYKTSIEI